MSKESVPQSEPVSVLFVCLGNICRSTMAEGVFREQTAFGSSKQHQGIKAIDSCGTGAYHTGASPDSRTMSVLKNNDITSYRHKARKVRVPQDFEEFDYILAMDAENLHDLRDSAKRAIKKGSLDESALSKIQLFGTYGGKAKDEEIDDPYYGGSDGFKIAYEQVSRFGKGLLKHIEEEAGGSSKI